MSTLSQTKVSVHNGCPYIKREKHRRRVPNAKHSRTVTAAASADAISGDSGPITRRYAALHDFCMQIPYGTLIVISGVVMALKGPLAAGVLLSIVGGAVLLCAKASLRAWKLGRPSTTYTVLSSISTAYLTWLFGLKFKMLVSKVEIWGPLLFSPIFALFVLSAAITAFQVYNVLAGGNPPPKKS